MPLDLTMQVANPRLLPHRGGTGASSSHPTHGLMFAAVCGLSAPHPRTGHDLRLR